MLHVCRKKDPSKGMIKVMQRIAKKSMIYIYIYIYMFRSRIKSAGWERETLLRKSCQSAQAGVRKQMFSIPGSVFVQQQQQQIIPFPFLPFLQNIPSRCLPGPALPSPPPGSRRKVPGNRTKWPARESISQCVAQPYLGLRRVVGGGGRVGFEEEKGHWTWHPPLIDAFLKALWSVYT